MLKCPKCKHPKSDVFDSRPRGEGITRRRTCQKCGTRFSTQERVVVSVVAQPTPKPKKPPQKAPKRRLTAIPTPKPKPREPEIDSMSDDELEAYIFGSDNRFDPDEI